jgi:FtsP/CotA-like multicopper oxidase with cupredoxin domain
MRRKLVAYATTLLMAFVFAGEGAVQASSPSPPPGQAGQKHITAADRKAAAARLQAKGVTAVAALSAAQVVAGVPSRALAAPLSTADYFGTTPNYANSSLPPIVIFSSADLLGSGATGEASVANGGVEAILVTNPGSGYDVPPLVGVFGLDGAGASASSTIGAGGAVTGVTVSSVGAGYGGIRKFVDSLAGLGSAGANDLGQFIPIAVPDTTTYPGADYYVIEVAQYSEKLSSDLPATLLRGYNQMNSSDPNVTRVSYLGPMIIAQKDRPVRVTFINNLPIGSGGDLFLPVDTTVGGAGLGPLGASAGNYTQNRATLHLHGGNTPWISDGTEHQWITPALETTAYPKGVSVQNVPDMPDPGAGAMTFYYTNQQSARLMFYHDHSYGITRLNVYAGEAAGYVLQDPAEQDLVNGTNLTGVNPNGLKGVIPATQIPLIIQDRTFVPGPNQLAAEDPTWSTSAYGASGALWYPHVYMPNQNPVDISGANADGRWDYGPWFWPPFTGIVNGEIPNPLFGAAHPNEPPMIPGTPNPSIVPEGFMDTPTINGTVYPFAQVGQQAYRFRILNASNDRSINLQLYYAKSNGPMWTTDANGQKVLNDANAGEVPMVPAVTTAGFPATWPSDGRDGGVPDPRAAGPQMIQIGTEGGFLPQAVQLPNQPVNYLYNRRDITVLNVSSKTLFLGPAERADVIIDFSQVPAGSKLILYNDAPAPVPAFDPRYDYYTGDPDQTSTGGAPTTVPGYGPNTRTLMQFQVQGALGASLTLTSGGKGYTQPSVSFSGGGGTGATATATGSVDAVAVTGGGSYANPTVSFSGVGGATATASGTVNPVATVNQAGSGYTQPTATITGGTATVTGGVDAIAVPPASPPTSTYPASILAGGPGGYWRLNDSGGTAADQTINANTGTLSGTITEGVPGLITGTDTAMSFDGVAPENINVGNNASLQSSSGTIEAWVKTTAVPTLPADSGFSGILVKQLAYAIFEYSNGHLVTYDWTTGTVQDSGVAINDGLTHHVVMTYQDGVAGGSQLYVDGVAAGAAFTYNISNQSSAMTIGAGSAGGGQTFNGTIDEAAFYPTVLSAAQVQADYNVGITPPVSSYTAPVVAFSGGGGAGAEAVAVLDGAGAITGFTIINPGSGYSSAPSVTITDSTGPTVTTTSTLKVTAVSVSATGTFTSASAIQFFDVIGGNGNNASATATLSLTSITVNLGGAGYSSAPAVVISGGSGASATATLTVTGLVLTSAGTGYTSAPTVSISDTTGSGATATAALAASAGTPYSLANLMSVLPAAYAKFQAPPIVPNSAYNAAFGQSGPSDSYVRIQATSISFFNGPLTALTLTNGGSGYASAPTVAISGGGGTGATATAVLAPAAVASLALTGGGSGFTSAPAVAFSGGGGTGAAATATLATRTVASASVSAGGNAYTTVPTVTFSGGVGVVAATGRATVTNRRVTAIVVLTPGSGYVTAPTITISGGGGSGARATATLAPTNVAGLTLTNGGTGYASAPTVAFTGGAGSGATATATLALAPVASLLLTSGGTNYTSAPVVTISGGSATATAVGVNMQLQPKSIIEDFDPTYGRMNAMLGVEVPKTTATNATSIPYYDSDPATEIIQAGDAAAPIGTLADGTQIWKITHNGVDTHAIHWHMFNVQLINRVGWDGAVRPPDANELGWKDTVRMNPLEDVIVALRPIIPIVPFDVPNSIRPMDPTMPVGASMLNEFHNVDPTNQPATVTNQIVNFGWEYVWHCHLLGHEENIMMRPMIIGVAPKPATNVAAIVASSTGKTARVTLTWSDNSINETGFTVQRATTANGPWTTIATGVPGAAAGTGTVTFTDTTARHTTYFYRVFANNVVGYTQTYAAPAAGYPHPSFDSAASNSATVTTP